MVATGKRTAEEHRDIGAKKGKFDRNSQPRKPFAGKSDAKKSFSKSGTLAGAQFQYHLRNTISISILF